MPTTPMTTTTTAHDRQIHDCKGSLAFMPNEPIIVHTLFIINDISNSPHQQIALNAAKFVPSKCNLKKKLLYVSSISLTF